jgi:hypothetical protein
MILEIPHASTAQQAGPAVMRCFAAMRVKTNRNFIEATR